MNDSIQGVLRSKQLLLLGFVNVQATNHEDTSCVYVSTAGCSEGQGFVVIAFGDNSEEVVLAKAAFHLVLQRVSLTG